MGNGLKEVDVKNGKRVEGSRMGKRLKKGDWESVLKEAQWDLGWRRQNRERDRSSHNMKGLEGNWLKEKMGKG
jgi:hypothetical protein